MRPGQSIQRASAYSAAPYLRSNHFEILSTYGDKGLLVGSNPLPGGSC